MLLPYPPSMNRAYRTFRGRTVRSAAALAYREEVQEIASECIAGMFDGCVSVKLELHPVLPMDAARRAKKDPRWGLSVRRIDLDNAQKVALDALQGIAYHNDRQITCLSIRLGAPVEGGGLSVSIRPDEFWETPV